MSTPRCFFFSGPVPLGVQDSLGTEVDHTAMVDESLRFGGVTFWSFGGGGVLEFTRESQHDYGGTWTVRERIVLEHVGDGFRGRYHYDEMEEGNVTRGQCHIDAVVTMTPR